MSEGKYKLLFGGSTEEEVLIGSLEKGNAVIKGKAIKGKFKKGNCVFANKTQAWGRRGIKSAEGKVSFPAQRMEVSNKDYAGHIEWLPWGDEKGYMIEARYEPSCGTLDYQFQTTRLGLPTLANDLEHNYLEFPSGHQEFDIESNPVLVEFLKIHHINEDSLSKNPNSEHPLTLYKEVKEFNTKEFAAREADHSFDAMKIVKEANSFEKLKVLKIILSRVTEITYNTAEENSLYDSLLLYSSRQSEKFISCMDQYKVEVSKLIELAKAYNAFDTTVNGTLVVLKPEKNILLDGIDAKGEDMLTYLFENRLEPNVFEAIEKLNLYSQKFKK